MIPDILWQDFSNNQLNMTASATACASLILSVFELDKPSDYRIPYHIRTGSNPCDESSIRKKFFDVRFFALEERGTLHVRIWIDGRYICDGQSTVSTTPNRIRQVNLPVGNCVGYCIDVEFSGDVPLRGMAINYEPLAMDPQL